MLIDKVSIVEKSIKKYPKVRGVYFLINKKNEIVYVGMSDNCYERIDVHRSNVSKHFNRFFII